MIHPSFFTSRTMNALPVTTMMTFAGIWTWADDYGRGEWAPDLVKAAVWPTRRAMTEVKVEAAMRELVEAKVLCYYEVADHALLHVTAWNEFQQVSHPGKPKLPPCSIHEPDEWEEFRSASDNAREKFRRPSGDLPETFRRSVVKASSVEVSQVQYANRPRLVTEPVDKSQTIGLGGTA
jgi:hypothetical protein